MDNITVRRVDCDNFAHYISGIVRVFRDDEVVPWHKHDECVEWITRRTERGFYIAAACCGDEVVGYNEWIETYDDGRKILYLGVMQVDCDLRSRGIGRMLLEDGERYARHIGATHLRAMPEEERSHNFYSKYGFADTDTLHLFVCPTAANPTALREGTLPPFTMEVINRHTFFIGLAQSSGRHMYECANYHPESTGYTAKTVHLPEGYLQLRYKKNNDEKTAEALYWSQTPPTIEVIDTILAHAHAKGFDEVQFNVRAKHKELFANRQNIIKDGWEYEFIELEKEIAYV